MRMETALDAAEQALLRVLESAGYENGGNSVGHKEMKVSVAALDQAREARRLLMEARAVATGSGTSEPEPPTPCPTCKGFLEVQRSEGTGFGYHRVPCPDCSWKVTIWDVDPNPMRAWYYDERWRRLPEPEYRVMPDITELSFALCFSDPEDRRRLVRVHRYITMLLRRIRELEGALRR